MFGSVCLLVDACENTTETWNSSFWRALHNSTQSLVVLLRVSFVVLKICADSYKYWYDLREVRYLVRYEYPVLRRLS